MKATSLAVIALIQGTNAIKTVASPDVFGLNGTNYKNNVPTVEMSEIGINITEPSMIKNAEACIPGTWVTYHAKGIIGDGRVVTDTRQEHDGRPITFAIGAAEVQKCLDLGIQQLHKGDKATFNCPSKFAFGSAFTPAPIGTGAPIPLNSDINYEVEVINCEVKVPQIKPSANPVTTTLQPGRAFYLHLVDSDDTPNNLVLSTDPADYKYYWPGRYLFLEEKVIDDKAQQWFYNDMDGTIHNHESPGYKLQNDKGEAMVAGLNMISPYTSAFFPRDKRNWWYDPVQMTLGSMVGDIKSILGVFNSPKPQTYVQVGVENMMIQKSHHRWIIEYCNQQEMGTTQAIPTEMSSDWSVPLETYMSNGPEDNLRHGSEEANTPPVDNIDQVVETMDINGNFV